MQEMRVRSLGLEDPLEEEMATHSSIPVGKIPRIEETGELQHTGCNESDRTEHSELTGTPKQSYGMEAENLGQSAPRGE